MKRPISLALVLMLVRIFGGPEPAHAQTYRLTDIGGPPGYSITVGFDMNQSGQVTGSFCDYVPGRSKTICDTDVSRHAFLWDGEKLIDLGTLGGTYSVGEAVNNKGQVTGISYVVSQVEHGFFWDKQGMVDIGVLSGASGSEGIGINEHGQVLGDHAGLQPSNAFVWDKGKVTDLGTLGGSSSFGSAINAVGQVTGSSPTTGNAARDPFLWGKHEGMVDLGTLGGTDGVGLAVNLKGQVAGLSCVDAACSLTHPFFWDKEHGMVDRGLPAGLSAAGVQMNDHGEMAIFATNNTGPAVYHAILSDGQNLIDLNTFGAANSIAYAIDNKGRVTGAFQTAADAEFHAFLWNGSQLLDLNTLIDPADPLFGLVTLTGGFRIADSGYILALGYNAAGYGRTYVLKECGHNVPTGDPSSCKH